VDVAEDRVRAKRANPNRAESMSGFLHHGSAFMRGAPLAELCVPVFERVLFERGV
jgi:hypothetical protein